MAKLINYVGVARVLFTIGEESEQPQKSPRLSRVRHELKSALRRGSKRRYTRADADALTCLRFW